MLCSHRLILFLRSVIRATQNSMMPYCPALLSFCSVTHCYCYTLGKQVMTMMKMTLTVIM